MAWVAVIEAGAAVQREDHACIAQRGQVVAWDGDRQILQPIVVVVTHSKPLAEVVVETKLVVYRGGYNEPDHALRVPALGGEYREPAQRGVAVQDVHLAHMGEPRYRAARH